MDGVVGGVAEMNKNRELAELLGWADIKQEGSDRWVQTTGISPGPEGVRQMLKRYDTDLNAMREVWKVLKERGLWDEFLFYWADNKEMPPNLYKVEGPPLMGFNTVYALVNDLPGQVEAAIAVLSEGKGKCGE